MEPAKKLREGFEQPEVGELPPGVNYWIGKSNYFEALYLRALIELRNANKGIKRLKRVIEARDERALELLKQIGNQMYEIDRLEIMIVKKL